VSVSTVDFIWRREQDVPCPPHHLVNLSEGGSVVPMFKFGVFEYFVPAEGLRPFHSMWLEHDQVVLLLQQLPTWDRRKVRVLAWCPLEIFRGPLWTRFKGLLELEGNMKRQGIHHGESAGYVWVCEDFRERWPEVYDHLAAKFFEGDPKQPRRTSTLTLFGEDGLLKFCLRDREEGRCAFVGALDLVGGLECLSKSLAQGSIVWRLDRAAGHAEASRVKPQKKT